MISETCRRATRLALASAVLGLLTACASGPTASPSDPLEPMNRSIDRFNTAVDEAALKPLATAYKKHTPDPVRTGVRNFFSNLGDVWSVFGLRLLDRRASYLQAGDMLNEVALDKYTFTRQVWLQKRRSDVYDGDPPDEPELPDNRQPPPAKPATKP